MPALLRLLTVCASLAFLAPFASAQGVSPGQKQGTTASKPAPADPALEKIQTQIKEAKTTLARLDQPDAEAQLPPGITPDLLTERKRDLDQSIRSLTRTATLLSSLPDARKAADAARDEEKAWSHFAEKPPYSLLLADELQNRRAAAAEKTTTSRSSVSLFQRSLENIRPEATAADEKLRELTAATTASPDDPALKWKLAAAKDKVLYISSRSQVVSVNIELLETQIAASRAETDLLDRQIRAISKNVTLPEEDLKKITKAADDRIAGLRKESAEIRNRLRDANSARARARDALDQSIAANTSPDAKPDPLLSAQLETAETRADVLQFIAENMDAYAALELLVPEIYEKRGEYLTLKSRTERQAALRELQAYLERLAAWNTVASNELSAVIADLAKQDSLSNLITAADPRVKTFAERRELLWEKQLFLQRVVQSASVQQKNLGRWIGIFEEADRPRTWSAWTSDAWSKTKSVLESIWTFKLFEITNSVEQDGQKRTYRQGISLGVVISAILFFLIAYLIIGRFTRRLQSIAVSHGRIAEAQASTMRNWLMIVAGIVLALTTLHILKIPLTVFAFFGGALAIGLGFGTQTLIKNFISGIIVLFERKIRVGDIIEVGQISGKVVEINTRSSVVRSADGKETLVPNSVFLESQVTNQTLTNRRVRRTFRIGVAYGSQPTQVVSLLKECIDRHGLVLKEPAPVVTLEDFGTDALVFALYYWTEINNRTDATIVASDIRIMVEKRFAESGVGFPKTERDQKLMTDTPLKIELVPSEPEPRDAAKKSIP